MKWSESNCILISIYPSIFKDIKNIFFMSMYYYVDWLYFYIFLMFIAEGGPKIKWIRHNLNLKEMKKLEELIK